MAEFFRETLRFPPSDNYGLHAAAYERAYQQLRFSINEGGWGLASADLTASSALYGGLGSFVKWYRRFRALEKGRGACGRFFRPPTGGDGLTHVAESVQTSLDALVKYGITVADQPDEERFVILSLAGMAEHSPPGQHAVFRRVRGSVRHSFGSSPDLPLDAKGLLAGVSRSTVPFVHPRSCLADSAPGTVELHSSPMAYMALSCVEEMSEEAFLIVASLQLGLPQRVLELPERAHDASDRRIDSTWADLALTKLTESKGYHTISHNILVDLGCALMAECGVKASRRNVPEIPDRDRRGDDGKRADAVTFMSSPVLRHPTLGDEPVVTFDTTIVHAF